MIIGNLKFEAYFEILYSLYVVDSLRTLKVYHCIPSNHRFSDDNREFEV